MSENVTSQYFDTFIHYVETNRGVSGKIGDTDWFSYLHKIQMKFSISRLISKEYNDAMENI